MGLRDVKGNLPVTEQTMFPIASITKSFTVATLGTLVTEGRLDWDKPVRDYLPDAGVNGAQGFQQVQEERCLLLARYNL